MSLTSRRLLNLLTLSVTKTKTKTKTVTMNYPTPTIRNLTCLCVFALAVWVPGTELFGQFQERVGNNNQVPEVAKGIGVDSKLGDMIDPDLTFTDEDNNFVRMGDFFDGKRPVILSFNYSNCPKLCEVQLKHMTTALRDVDFDIGKDFQLVSVSIDPQEQLPRLRAMRDRYSGLYNREGSEDSWHFLRGSDSTATKYLADLCGVKYRYIARQKLYSHPPVFLLISPNGKIVRYIHGLNYEPVTIYRALVEAAEGKIGSPINRLTFVTGCFLFDETTGKYAMPAMYLMRLAGGCTVFFLAISIVPYWWVRRNRREDENNITTDASDLDSESNEQVKEVF